MNNYAKHENDDTAELARATFSYDPVTGDLIRIKVGRNHLRLLGKSACIKWVSARGQIYMVVTMNGRIWFAHRIAWLLYYGQWPKQQLDHKNCDSIDNKIENLLCVSTSQNNRNRKKQVNRSGYTGIYWRSDCGKWRSQIRVNTKLIDLGSFEDIDDAVESRKKAELEHGFYHGRGFQNE